MRYLGIDYGSRKTGLALSDEAGQMGFPHAVIQTADLASYLAKLVPEKDVGAVVIGESKGHDGSDNPIAEHARAAGFWIGETFRLPVYWEPEMYTSAEARRARDESRTGRSPKDESDVDASAAALILTSYLGKHHD